jgi:hypothetical protein
MTMLKASIAMTVAALAAAGGVVSAGVVAAATPAKQNTAVAPKTFIAVSPLSPTRLAVYSAQTGRLLKFLTAAEPGGGVSSPELTADGRTVIFARGHGTCAQTIDTVPANGGAERVLIPMTGTGSNVALPVAVSVSADGKYLLYFTTRCFGPLHYAVYLRSLHTGHTVTLAKRSPLLILQAVFVHRDGQVVYQDAGSLAVLTLRSMQVQLHQPAHGCRYGPLAGTMTLLAGVLECGRHSSLQVVAISARAFGVTRTLARFGSRCLAPFDLSIALRDPSAMLVDTGLCRGGKDAIMKIIHGKVTVLRSGPTAKVPSFPVW